jgi:hypothetical protein
MLSGGEKRMFLGRLQELFDHLKSSLRRERRTAGERSQLQELSEAIVEYGRMMQAHLGYSTPDVVVEVPEMARRFRETPKTIKEALVLLEETGRAQPIHLSDCWRLQLTSNRLRDSEDSPSATLTSRTLDDDSHDRGAA